MFPSVHIRKGVKDRTFNMNTEIADLFCIAQKTMISDIYSLCTQCRPKHVRSIIKSTGKWVGETNYSMSTFRKCIRWNISSGAFWEKSNKTTFQYNYTPTGKYGIRNHIWPLESGFLMRKSEKKGHNFLGPWGQIFKFTYFESSLKSSHLAKTKSLLIFV